MEIKVTWLTEIRKVLANQLKERKGHKSDFVFVVKLNLSLHICFHFLPLMSEMSASTDEAPSLSEQPVSDR